jgi:hypothetical protein
MSLKMAKKLAWEVVAGLLVVLVFFVVLGMVGWVMGDG